MTPTRKSENWLTPWPTAKAKTRYSSSTRANNSSNAKHAGSKPGRKARRSNILLYDSIYNCPLAVYIDVTCDDHLLHRLTLRGKPTLKQLHEARFKLMADFAELSNQGQTKAIQQACLHYYRQRSLLFGMELCHQVVQTGASEEAVQFLTQYGLSCTVPTSLEETNRLLENIQMKIKNRRVKLKEAKKAYDLLTQKSEKPNRQYYSKLLVMLSTCEAIKMQLNPNRMTVAEFAEYISLFQHYQNQLKFRNNGK